MKSLAKSPKITHVLADGRVVDDIRGHVIGKENEEFYQVVKEILRGNNYEKNQKVL